MAVNRAPYTQAPLVKSQSGLWLPPHLYPPAGAQPKNLAGYIDVPAPGDPPGVIFAYLVPTTMRLVCNQVGNNFVGADFTEGTGDLIWQIWDNGNPIEDFEAIDFSLGNVAQPTWTAPIIFEEGHKVSYVVINPAGGPIPADSGQVGATLRGWLYNRLDVGEQEWSV
jgi:hypothetical protein